MRGKRESGNREEAELSQETGKEELRVTGSPIGSGMTAEVVSGMTPYKKAGMTPASPSFPCSDMGIHKKGSPKSDSESGRSPSPSFPYSSLSSFPRRRESGKGDESGRSMVEMLGTLAIMGVLAIGGIVGYQYAMDKYNANEILNEVRKRAVVVSSQMTADQAVRLDEFPDRIQEHYPVLLKTNYQNNPDFFTIAVQEIPAGVCRHLLSEEPQMSVRLLLNSTVVTADTNCPTGTSEVGFVFERTLRQGEPTKGCDPACGDGQVCNDGRCVCGAGNQYCGGRFCCRPGYKCAGYGDWRCLPKCTSDTECAIGERCSIGGTCGECLSNADCDANEFCALGGSGYPSHCAGPQNPVGSCEVLDYEAVVLPEGTFYVSKRTTYPNETDGFCAAIPGARGVVQWTDIGYESATESATPSAIVSGLYGQIGDKRIWVRESGVCGDDTIHLKTGTKGHAYGEYRNYAVCKG